MSEMSPLSPLPWRDIIATGLGVLKLSPQSLWQMTPVEFTLALKGAGLLTGAHTACTSATLRKLMQQFPDQA